MMTKMTAGDGLARGLSKFCYGFLIAAFCCSGCVVVPKKVASEEDSRCQLVTRKVTLGMAENGSRAVLDGALRTTLSCNRVECLLIFPAALVAIPVGSVVVSGSIMVGGNTIHWLEAQGRCDDSVSRSAVNGFVEVTKAAGGKVVESYQELAAWLAKYFPQAEQLEMQSSETGPAAASNPESP